MLCLQLDELPMMVNGVFSSVLAEQFDATQKFRKLLSIGACMVHEKWVSQSLTMHTVHRAKPAH